MLFLNVRDEFHVPLKCTQVKISRKWQRRFSPLSVCFTWLLPLWHQNRNLLTALTCVSPVQSQLTSVNLRLLVRADQLSPERLRSYGGKKRPRVQYRSQRHQTLASTGHPGSRREGSLCRLQLHSSIFHLSWASWEINKDTTYLRTYSIWHCTKKMLNDVSRSIPHSNRLLHKI